MRGSLWQPTDADRRVTEAMAACGVPQVVIAETIGISHVTLRKHLATELAAGLAKANAKVVEFLYGGIVGTATQPPFQSEYDRMIAAMFWLKCRAGWVRRGAEFVRPVSAMTDAEIDARLGLGQEDQ
jgi:hypothetical protein